MVSENLEYKKLDFFLFLYNTQGRFLEAFESKTKMVGTSFTTKSFVAGFVPQQILDWY